MPTLRERKNPGVGTKVNLGKDAPVNKEAAGLVKSESLAAESYDEGGEFTQNRNAQPEGASRSGQKTETSGLQDAADLQKAHGRHTMSAAAGEAPGSAADQGVKDTKGPHGKKIKEGISDDKAGGDRKKDSNGLQRALRAEPGSEDDPSRLAERQMLQGRMGSGGAGARQSEITGETRFDVLEREADSWLRQLFDRFHSIRIFAFRDGSRLEDAPHHNHGTASMPVMPEEKSMLRPLQRPEADSRPQQQQRDVSKSSSVDAPPPREGVDAQEMEHQRYGEAQPQLVPSDVIETMMMGKRRKDGLGV
ncbi:hypothetical protein ACQKWADRAFT_313402 [Trichoderma austrokoningii]